MPGHFARDCQNRKNEGNGRPNHSEARGNRKADARRVNADELNRDTAHTTADDDPLTYLHSSDSDEVCLVRVHDQGSRPRRAEILVQDVFATGVIDTGADITIMGGSLFKKVAAAAKLGRRDFKKADKVPRVYNNQKFTLDGRMDLDITFGDKTMKTPVYIKMDSSEPLLLSRECVVNLLWYHIMQRYWPVK